ncbi:MAG: AAA family ATPase [Nitriliruptoraceae bacterium]
MSTVAVIAGDDYFEHLRRVLSDNGAVHHLAGEQIVDLLTRSVAGPEVVVLGPGLAFDDACGFAGQIDRIRSDVATVLVAQPDAGVLAAALRVGVRDVLGPDADDQEVRNVIERAAAMARSRRQALPAEPAAARSSGRIITIASPKGGSGKTTVATNLAVELGRRVPGEVVIVDLDLQFGDVATSLRLEPEHHVADAVAALSGDDMILKTYLTSHPSGCYALCAPESPAAADSVTGDQVRGVLERLAQGFRYVIVDTSPGLAEHTLAALEVSQRLVMLAGMDVPSVRGLHRELEILDELHVDSSAITIVLNFVDRRSGLKVDDVAAMLQRDIDIELPRSYQVTLSTNRGVPLLTESSRDPVAKRLRALTDLVDARRGART